MSTFPTVIEAAAALAFDLPPLGYSVLRLSTIEVHIPPRVGTAVLELLSEIRSFVPVLLAVSKVDPFRELDFLA